MQKNLNCKWINVDVCRILVEPTQDDQEGQNNGGFEPLLLSTGNLLLKRTIARMYISYSFDIGWPRVDIMHGLLTYSLLNTLHLVIQQIYGFKHLRAANAIICE